MPYQVVTYPDNASLTYLLLSNEDVSISRDYGLDLGLVGGFIMGTIPCCSIRQDGENLTVLVLFGDWPQALRVIMGS
jgi:hypothetical protein